MKTFDRLDARNRGAALTASTGGVTTMLNERIEKATDQPTEAELQAIAKAMYEEKLAELCTQQRSMPTLADAHRYGNQAYADYFQRLATYGGGLSLLPADIARLEEQGWDHERIEALRETVRLREEGHTGILRSDLDRHLQRAGFTPDDRLRWVLELALYRSYRDAFLAANDRLDGDMALPSDEDVVAPLEPVIKQAATSLPQAEPIGLTVPAEWASVTPTKAAEMYIEATPRLRGDRTADKRNSSKVGEQTLRQIRWAAGLLEMSMPFGMPFWRVTKADILRLDYHFDQLPQGFGKSVRDRRPGVRLERVVLDAAEMIDNGELQMEDVGLTIGTTNKHFNKLAQIHTFMRKAVRLAEEIDFAEFTRTIDMDEREARVRYTPEQGRAIFNLSPWTGCRGPVHRLEPGNVVVHDALFYVLLLVWYTGARREELCKLMIDDVEQAHGIWYLLIRPTETGRIKNKASRRVIAVCDELLRLGFIDYVEALRVQGERLLFPEIMPADLTSRKFGDVFYKLWWIYLAPQIPGLQRGQAMHSARHMVSTELKEQEIFLEFRNDLLGHSGKGGEGENRYPDRASLEKVKALVDRIPVVTDHIPDQTRINLLPAEMRKARPTRLKNSES